VRRPALITAALVVAAGLAAPAAALPATASGPEPDPSSAEYWDGKDWSGNHWDPAKVGDPWDGGSAEQDGTRFSWPEDTYSYAGKVCPDMDVAKTDVKGETGTLTLTAPEGELVSAYCLKSGSGDLGPKLVVLDEPVAEIVVAYPAGGKCKAISHYAVEYVDAAAEASTAQAPARAEVRHAPAKVAHEGSPGDVVEEIAGKPAPAATPQETSTPVDDAVVGEEGAEDAEVVARQLEGDVEPEPAATLEAAPAAPSLALTGAQVATLVVAALVLVAAGVTTLVVVRRRTTSE
jgi:hypothetical protein